MISLKGITVTLFERVQVGTDSLNSPIYTEVPVDVDNVLVAPMTGDSDIQKQASPTELEGQKAVYRIAVPKDDTHVWENCRLSFFGHKWKVVGPAEQGMEHMLPLAWNKKYTLECIDGEEG